MKPRSTRPLVRTMAHTMAALVLAALVALAVSTAHAGSWTGNDYVNTGGYLVIGGLTAFDDFQLNAAPPIGASLGFVIKGGYRFLPYLAAEVEGDFLSGFDAVVQTPAGSGVAPFALTVDGGAVTANALAYFPLGRIQPHAIVGLGGSWNQLRTTNPVGFTCSPSYYWWWYCTGVYARLADGGGYVMRFGAGVDLYAAKDWAVNVDGTYVLPFGDLADLPYWQLNWAIKFAF